MASPRVYPAPAMGGTGQTCGSVALSRSDVGRASAAGGEAAGSIATGRGAHAAEEEGSASCLGTGKECWGTQGTPLLVSEQQCQPGRC